MSIPSSEYFTITQPVQFVSHVEINRPSKLNAFKEPMWSHLSSIFIHLSTDPETRVIILSGSGDRAFTTGLDTKAAAESGPLSSSPDSLDVARKATALRRHITHFQSCISSISSCEKPVIVVFHGFSYGLAIDIGSACDVRICSADTRFCVKEVDIGLAADVGTLSRLPKVVGNHSWVKDVSLSAREFDAEEALRVGFVSAVYQDKKEVLGKAVNWATLVAGKSPVAVQGTKRILDYSVDHSVEDGLHYTAVWNAAMLQSGDVGEAMGSGLMKRKPRFEKL